MKNRFFGLSLVLLMLFIIAIVIVIVFTSMPGDRLIRTNHSFSRWLLENVIGSLRMDRFVTEPEIYQRLPEYRGYAQRLNEIDQQLEHLIHIILFFGLTVATLVFMNIIKVRLILNMIVSLAFGVSVSFFSELYQNGIYGRGFEHIDIITNTVGVLIAIFVFVCTLLIHKTLDRTGRKDKQSAVSIRYFSGEDYFS